MNLKARAFAATCYTLVAVLVSVSTALAGQSQQIPRKPLRFGIMALTPYGFYDDNRQPRGDHYDIARAILKEGNFPGKVVIEPLNRLTRSVLVKKDLDCSVAGEVPFIRDNYRLVEPIGVDLNFGLLPGRQIAVDSYDDLQGKQIGLPLGVTIGQPFDGDDSLNKIGVRNYQTAMLMLSRGRLDAVAGVISSLRFSGRRHGYTADSWGAPLVLRKVPLWVICRPGFADEKLESEIRTTVARLRDNGAISRILGQYPR